MHASQTKALGLKFAVGLSDYGVSFGYDKETHLAVSTNTAVRLEWSSADLFGVRAGTNFAPELVSRTSGK